MKRFIHASVVAVAACGLCGSASADVFQWGSGTSGNWSLATNWTGGISPPMGGTSDADLWFGLATPSPTTFVYTATNDLPGVFTLNRLFLLDSTKASITIRNASGAGLSFAGANPRIEVSGLNAHTLSTASGGLGVALPGPVGVQVQSPGGSASSAAVTLSGPITGSGGLIVSGPEVASNLGVVQISASASANNTFAGGVTLSSGNLLVDGSTATATPLGAGTLTINAGTIGFNNTLTRIAGPIVANTDLRIARGTGTINGQITVNSPTAALQVYGGSLTLNVPAAFAGTTLLGGRDTYAASTGSATLTLGSVAGVSDGTLPSTSSIDLRAGSALNIGNTTTNLANRVNDAAAATLDSSVISLRAASAGSSESLGALTVRGYSVLECQPGGSSPFGSAALTVASLSRDDRGVLFVRGQNLGLPVGSPTSGTRYTTIAVGAGAPTLVGGGGAGGTTTISILPWGTASFSASSSTAPTANSLVTYGPSGFRPLNPSTEFASSIGTDPTQNVMVTAAGATNDDPGAAVNSLVLSSASTVSIGGAGTISVASGAVLANLGGSTSTISNALSFGTAEGVITTSGPLSISGSLLGSGGLTKVGSWPLILSGDNTALTGPLTISAAPGGTGGALVSVFGEQNLPGTGPVTIHSIASTSGAGIGVSDNFVATNNPIAISRPLVLRGGLCGLTSLTATTEAHFTGVISGAGSLNINSAGSFGTIELTGTNSFAGITRVSAGRLRIHSDSNLGSGGPLVLATSTGDHGLDLAGDWTTSRLVQVLGATGFHTHGFDAVLNAPLAGSSEVWLDGAGSVTLNADSPYTGSIYIRDGELRVNSILPAIIRASVATTNSTFLGATLGGTGHVGDATLQGILEPGSAATPHGTFSLSSLTLAGACTVPFDLGPGGDLVAVDAALAQALVALPPPNNTTYVSVFTGCNFAFTQLPGVQIGQTYDLVHFGTNGAINVTTQAIDPLTVFTPSHFTYTGLAPGFAGTFELTPSALLFHIVPEQHGVCCQADGSCFAAVPGAVPTCATGAMVLNGTCGSTLCGTGACCQADGSCTIATPGVAQATCSSGTLVTGGVCGTMQCQFGMCCDASGACTVATPGVPASCPPGGSLVVGGTCGSIPCQWGACCQGDGSCILAAPGSSATCASGVLVLNGTCGSIACPQFGVCCRADGSCVAAVTGTQATCSSGTLVYAGVCGTTPCSIGVCCQNDGSCILAIPGAPATCATGTLVVNGTCGSTPCSIGVCCQNDGSCILAIPGAPATCATGTLVVNGTCEVSPCQYGACCHSFGTCHVATPGSPATCAAGERLALWTTCGPGLCEVGVCCGYDGSCTVLFTDQTFCAGGTVVPGGMCGVTACTFGACCQTNGACTLTSGAPARCATGSLVPGGVCSPNTCPQPGVCCRGATCNATIAQGACVGNTLAGSVFVAASGACNPGGIATAPCCYADYNKTGGVSVGDIFDFLNDWFAVSRYAIVGGNGESGTLTVQHIFDFLNAWFAGGC